MRERSAVNERLDVYDFHLSFAQRDAPAYTTHGGIAPSWCVASVSADSRLPRPSADYARSRHYFKSADE